MQMSSGGGGGGGFARRRRHLDVGADRPTLSDGCVGVSIEFYRVLPSFTEFYRFPLRFFSKQNETRKEKEKQEKTKKNNTLGVPTAAAAAASASNKRGRKHQAAQLLKACGFLIRPLSFISLPTVFLSFAPSRFVPVVAVVAVVAVVDVVAVVRHWVVSLRFLSSIRLAPHFPFRRRRKREENRTGKTNAEKKGNKNAGKKRKHPKSGH